MESTKANLVCDRLAATNWQDRVWYAEWDNEQPVYVVEAPLPSP